MTSEVAIESGIEVQTIRVDRQEPRKSRIINAVSAGSDAVASRTHLAD